VHPGLEWLRGSAAGTAWLDRLPALLEECREQWSLELEEPFADAFASLAVPAGDVVLKIQFPDHESEHEAEALRVWDGDGAVRLLEHDARRTPVSAGTPELFAELLAARRRMPAW
jgi:streptomycin 6-kinase